jgi:hypothetical protein
MMRGGFSGTAGKAVAGGAGEGRLVAIGRERPGKYASQRLGKLDIFHGRAEFAQPCCTIGNQRGGLVIAE